MLLDPNFHCSHRITLKFKNTLTYLSLSMYIYVSIYRWIDIKMSVFFLNSIEQSLQQFKCLSWPAFFTHSYSNTTDWHYSEKMKWLLDDPINSNFLVALRTKEPTNISHDMNQYYGCPSRLSDQKQERLPRSKNQWSEIWLTDCDMQN